MYTYFLCCIFYIYHITHPEAETKNQIEKNPGWDGNIINLPPCNAVLISPKTRKNASYKKVKCNNGYPLNRSKKNFTRNGKRKVSGICQPDIYNLPVLRPHVCPLPQIM